MKKVIKISMFLFFVFTILNFQMVAQEDVTYQLPPGEIVKLIDTPGSPYVGTSPDGNFLLIIERPSLPSIEDVSQPELKLAGLRINPRTNGRSRTSHYNKIKLKNLKTRKEYPISGLPEKPKISSMRFSPDGKKISFTVTRANGIELWVADIMTGKAHKLTEPVLNASTYGSAYQWLSNSSHILFKAVLKDRGDLPEKDRVPKGPVIQLNEGRKAPVRTYQDLLKNKHDEALFTYYATSQLMITDLQGNIKPVGKPGIIQAFSSSPDGNYILAEIVKKPFSYLVPYRRFPQSVEIWDPTGKLVKQIADVPLADNIPKGFNSTRKGPREFDWRRDAPAQLYWVEALDEGNPRNKAELRDKLFLLDAPFDGKPTAGPAMKNRFYDVEWCNGKLAMINDFWWKSRNVRTMMFQPDNPGKPAQVVFDRSYEDRYNDPGSFATAPNKYGQNVLLTDKKGRYLYLTGQGASPEGNRPFIDKFNIKTKKITRMWRSKAPYYETVIDVIDVDKNKVLTRREGKKVQPNYFIRSLKSGKLKQVTNFPHPYPQLKDLEMQILKYKRPDGVELSGNLYLPPAYKKSDGPLPIFLWAYPREFKSRSAAGQMSDSPYRFIRLHWSSALIWVTQGYAVLDRASMPILGEGDKEPNDTFVEQLVANGKAAIDKLAEMGVGDPKRAAIGGHSYGAFMTANLLAHSRLFAAGIARSGAYNRSLTPFGFQAEERTLWEATNIYVTMSPFMHAHKVKDPLLLIHGSMDNNSGTFPIQSERFYHALKGHGATVRLVMLPFESHGYRARESVMHMWWESFKWLEKYVKNKK